MTIKTNLKEVTSHFGKTAWIKRESKGLFKSSETKILLDCYLYYNDYTIKLTYDPQEKSYQIVLDDHYIFSFTADYQLKRFLERIINNNIDYDLKQIDIAAEKLEDYWNTSYTTDQEIEVERMAWLKLSRKTAAY